MAFNKFETPRNQSCLICEKKYGTNFHPVPVEQDVTKNLPWNQISPHFISNTVFQISQEIYKKLRNSHAKGNYSWDVCLCHECYKLTQKTQLLSIKIKELFQEFVELKRKLRVVACASFEEGGEVNDEGSSLKRPRRAKGHPLGGFAKRLRGEFYKVYQKKRDSILEPRSTNSRSYPTLQLVRQDSLENGNSSDGVPENIEIHDLIGVEDYDDEFSSAEQATLSNSALEELRESGTPGLDETQNIGLEDEMDETESIESTENAPPKIRRVKRPIPQSRRPAHTSSLRKRRRSATPIPSTAKKLIRKSKSSKVREVPKEGVVYNCKLCGNSYSTKHGYNIHYSRAHLPENEKPLSCEICFKKFTQRPFLQYHKRAMHYKELGLLPHKCSYCSKILCSERTLRFHIQQLHTKEYRFKCNHCDAGFAQEKELREHISGRHTKDRPHQCTYCSKSFSRKGALTKHVKTHTSFNQEQINQNSHCVVCDKEFLSVQSLRRHNEATHGTILHECSQCGKRYRKKEIYQRHIKQHDSSRPKFKCEICDKEFYKKESLNIHVEAHGTIIYECEICQKQFRGRGRLNIHVYGVHRKKKNKVSTMVKCHVCDKELTQYSLKEHLTSHDPSLFTKCERCGIRIRTTTKDKHMKWHEKRDEMRKEKKKIIKDKTGTKKNSTKPKPKPNAPLSPSNKKTSGTATAQVTNKPKSLIQNVIKIKKRIPLGNEKRKKITETIISKVLQDPKTINATKTGVIKPLKKNKKSDKSKAVAGQQPLKNGGTNCAPGAAPRVIDVIDIDLDETEDEANNSKVLSSNVSEKQPASRIAVIYDRKSRPKGLTPAPQRLGANPPNHRVIDVIDLDDDDENADRAAEKVTNDQEPSVSRVEKLGSVMTEEIRRGTDEGLGGELNAENSGERSHKISVVLGNDEQDSALKTTNIDGNSGHKEGLNKEGQTSQTTPTITKSIAIIPTTDGQDSRSMDGKTKNTRSNQNEVVDKVDHVQNEQELLDV